MNPYLHRNRMDALNDAAIQVGMMVVKEDRFFRVHSHINYFVTHPLTAGFYAPARNLVEVNQILMSFGATAVDMTQKEV